MGELSLNVGFGLPLGSAVNGVNQSDVINFAIPFGIEVGYRIGGVVFVGGTFTYGPFGSPSTSTLAACGATGNSCHSNDYRVGFTVQWHPLGSRGLDPYIGVGAGYEWLTVDLSGNGMSVSSQYNGWTWLDVPIGVDFRLSKEIRLGPYVDFSMGQYRNASVTLGGVSAFIQQRALHFWLDFGARVVFLGF